MVLTRPAPAPGVRLYFQIPSYNRELINTGQSKLIWRVEIRMLAFQSTAYYQIAWSSAL